MAKKPSSKSDLFSYKWTGITAFTPFFRRFVNERKRETKELKALYNRVAKLHKEADIDLYTITREIMEKAGVPLENDDIWECVVGLISQCDELFPHFRVRKLVMPILSHP